jgi:hypothetical protein
MNVYNVPPVRTGKMGLVDHVFKTVLTVMWLEFATNASITFLLIRMENAKSAWKSVKDANQENPVLNVLKAIFLMTASTHAYLARGHVRLARIKINATVVFRIFSLMKLPNSVNSVMKFSCIVHCAQLLKNKITQENFFQRFRSYLTSHLERKWSACNVTFDFSFLIKLANRAFLTVSTAKMT